MEVADTNDPLGLGVGRGVAIPDIFDELAYRQAQETDKGNAACSVNPLLKRLVGIRRGRSEGEIRSKIGRPKVQ